MVVVWYGPQKLIILEWLLVCIEYRRKQNGTHLRNILLLGHTFQFVLLLIPHHQAEVFKVIKLLRCSSTHPECFNLKWKDSELYLACVRLFSQIQN